MSIDETETEPRKRASKRNIVRFTVPPHIRLAVDKSEYSYAEMVAYAAEQLLDKTERDLRLEWREHVREAVLSETETKYCWRGMRGGW